MGGVDQSLLLALGAVTATWIVLLAGLVGTRALRDLGMRRVGEEGVDGPIRQRAARELAADAATDPQLAGSLAAHVVATDSEGLLEAAADTRAGIGAWRRAEALHILARAGHRESVPALEHALVDGDLEVAAVAVTILGELRSDEAASVLVRALQSGACPPTWIAAQLERFPDESGHLLTALLNDLRPSVREWGARLLARPLKDESLIAELARLCHDPDAGVRAAALQSLAEVGGTVAVESARALLSDPAWYVRVRAARALGRLNSVEDVRRLAELLSESQWWVRSAAKDALTALGRSITDDLIPFLDDADAFARNGAAEVLQDLGVIDALVADIARRRRPQTPAAIAVRALLRKILEAGGPRVMNATLARADPDVRPQLEQLAELAPDQARAA